MSSRSTYEPILAAALLSALLLTACDTAPTEPDPELAASQITIYGGDNQVGAALSTLPMPLAVRVTDSGNRGVRGVRILWQVTSGAGELSSWPEERPLVHPSTVTDASGVARSPTRPDPPAVSCVLPALPSGFNAPALTPLAVRPAVLDAQARLAAVLSQSPAATELRTALATLAPQLGGGAEPACSALREAFDALGRYETAHAGEAATLPDRVMIRLVLHLTSAAR